MKRFSGAPLETILDAVEQAVSSSDMPILDDIARQIEEYHAQRPDVHGFIEWLWLLRGCAASLPDRLPRSVLLLWRDKYVPKCSDAGPSCPMPLRRCEDCKMVLPNEPVNPCPVCGSERIFHADFSKPLGENWIDPRPARRRAAAE